MFRMYGKLVKSNKILVDHVVEITDLSMTRTAKVYAALDEICHRFDLAKPIWLPSNKEQFIRSASTRFTSDNFIESIEFDYLQFQVLEEEFYV